MLITPMPLACVVTRCGRNYSFFEIKKCHVSFFQKKKRSWILFLKKRKKQPIKRPPPRSWQLEAAFPRTLPRADTHPYPHALASIMSKDPYRLGPIKHMEEQISWEYGEHCENLDLKTPCKEVGNAFEYVSDYVQSLDAAAEDIAKDLAKRKGEMERAATKLEEVRLESAAADITDELKKSKVEMEISAAELEKTRLESAISDAEAAMALVCKLREDGLRALGAAEMLMKVQVETDEKGEKSSSSNQGKVGGEEQASGPARKGSAQTPADLLNTVRDFVRQCQKLSVKSSSEDVRNLSIEAGRLYPLLHRNQQKLQRALEDVSGCVSLLDGLDDAQVELSKLKDSKRKRSALRASVSGVEEAHASAPGTHEAPLDIPTQLQDASDVNACLKQLKGALLKFEGMRGVDGDGVDVYTDQEKIASYIGEAEKLYEFAKKVTAAVQDVLSRCYGCQEDAARAVSRLKTVRSARDDILQIIAEGGQAEDSGSDKKRKVDGIIKTEDKGSDSAAGSSNKRVKGDGA